MITVWGTLTIGAAAVAIPAVAGGACKLSFQVAPGATGSVKIGGAGLTSDNTTPGTFLSSSSATNADGSEQAGGFWSVEAHEDVNVIHPETYNVHGTHAGDLVFYEYHQI